MRLEGGRRHTPDQIERLALFSRLKQNCLRRLGELRALDLGDQALVAPAKPAGALIYRRWRGPPDAYSADGVAIQPTPLTERKVEDAKGVLIKWSDGADTVQLRLPLPPLAPAAFVARVRKSGAYYVIFYSNRPISR